MIFDLLDFHLNVGVVVFIGQYGVGNTSPIADVSNSTQASKGVVLNSEWRLISPGDFRLICAI